MHLDGMCWLFGDQLGSHKCVEIVILALENNLIVMEILSAAVESAKTGKTVYLK